MTDSTILMLGASSLALAVVLYVWFALALAALFRKAGIPAWKAWVPVLNVATVLQLGGFSPWLVLLNLAPLFGAIAFFVVFVIAVHRITVGFGAGGGLTVVGALVPVVWASILGFGSARWEGGEVRARGVDEDSAPIRRGRDFDGPYVPLMGGWTPQQEPATPLAEQESDDREVSVPVSEPVVQPFASPSGSLADAVPSPSDWAPPTVPRPASADETRPLERLTAEQRSRIPAQGSVFEVLDALRDHAPAEEAGARSALSRAAEPGVAPTERAGDDRDARAGAAPRAGASPVEPDDAAPTARPAVDDDALPTRAVPLAGDAVRGAPAWEASHAAEAVAAPATRDDEAGDDFAALWANPPRRTPRPDDEAAAPIADVPLTRPAPEPVPAPRSSRASATDEFPELSEAVSAVAEVPEAGTPRSARTSVSALYTRPEVPAEAPDDDLDELDRTVVTRRKRIPWALVPPNGATVDLTSSVVILGRRPAPDAAHPDAQLVSISDETRTVSKTHARLELRGDTWFVTDLDSTNGVLFATLMGTEVEAPPGEEIEAGERFFLGDAEVRLTRRPV